jgi:hypothetical protein
MTEGSKGETMKDIVKGELGAPQIVDRSTFQAERDALRVREKATPLRPPADGSPWSRWIAPRRSLANVAP